MDAHEVAAALRAIAERIERLPAYRHRDPHAFHEDKSVLSADVVALAEIITARRDPPSEPIPLPSAPRRRRPLAILFERSCP